LVPPTKHDSFEITIAVIIIVRQLIDHYHREKESIVRWKIAHVLGVFAKHPQCASDSVVEEIISLLKTESKYI
jgi:hypothetical protein